MQKQTPPTACTAWVRPVTLTINGNATSVCFDCAKGAYAAFLAKNPVQVVQA